MVWKTVLTLLIFSFIMTTLLIKHDVTSTVIETENAVPPALKKFNLVE